MRTKEEVQEAMRHLVEAQHSTSYHSADIATKLAIHSAIDLMRWVLKDPHSRFEAAVIEPCRRVERAGRQ